MPFTIFGLRPDLACMLGIIAFFNLTFIYFCIFVYSGKKLSPETVRRPRSFISNAVFREYWYYMMDPLKRKFLDWDTAPNTITVWGMIFSVVAGVLFAFGQWGFGAVAVTFASTCDVYDGMLARARNISLKSGSFFDSVMDRICETFMFYGLLWHFRDNNFWFFVIFMGAMAGQIVSYSRARAEGLGFGGARGFFQRAERMIVFSIGFGFVPLFYVIYPPAADILVKVTILLVCFGSIQTSVSRTVGIYLEIRGTERPLPKKRA